MNSSFIKLSFTISIVSLLMSCKTSKISTDTNKTLNEVDIYVVGYEYNDSKFESSIEEIADEVGMKHVAKLWKNGKDIHLENSELYSDAKSVFVNNNDVYIVGSIILDNEYVATIWKNGKIQKLTNGKTAAHTSSLFIDKNNIYILGAQYNTKNYMIKVWKNGVYIDKKNGKNPTDDASIFV